MKKTSLLICLLLTSFLAFNQKIVEKTIGIKGQKNVTFDFDFADEIKITGWDKNEISVKATVNINDNEDNASFKMEAEELSNSIHFISDIEKINEISKNRVTIHESRDGKRSVSYHDGWCTDININFEIFVPKNMKIDVKTINGDVTLTNVTDELNIETISGLIDLAIQTGAKASIKTSTITGSVYSNHDIQLNNYDRDKKYRMVIGRSPDFDLNGGGRSIDLKTISGDIYIRK